MGDFWKPTAEMFGSLFEKPKMSEKLLLKPPFKYIFDIILETMKITGFPKGLYNQVELDSSYYVTKDKKVLYLQKIIDLTQMTLKEKVFANPNKIIAGLESDLTNNFLQAVYRAALSWNHFNPYIEKINEFYQNQMNANNQVADQASQVKKYLQKKYLVFQENQIINMTVNLGRQQLSENQVDNSIEVRKFLQNTD